MSSSSAAASPASPVRLASPNPPSEKSASRFLESRHALGGRASSFEDAETPGELLDNCQHVLLGCCTNLLDLYRRLSVKQKITFHRRVHFLDGKGRRRDLWGLRGLPAPLHLGLSMTFFSVLTLGERAAAVRAMLAMARLGRAGREKLETIPFGQWLDKHRQSPELIKKFYDPIIISALNEDTRKASTKYAIQVFQDAMLANSHDGYLIGLPAVPLGELYAKLPQGVDVRLNARVEELLFADNRITGIKLRNEEILSADTVVLATNHHAVQRWMAFRTRPRCSKPRLPASQTSTNLKVSPSSAPTSGLTAPSCPKKSLPPP